MAKIEAQKAQHKVDAVQEMTSEFSNYDGYIFTDYRGMTVEQITELRNRLRSQEATFRVVKNRFAKLALSSLKHEGADEILTGPTAMALTKGEDASNAVSKIILEFGKESPVRLKGGIIGGELYDQEQIDAYGRLPSRMELIAMLMGTLQEPLAKLARTLQAMVDSQSN